MAEQISQLKNISVDADNGKPILRRKYTKNAESEVIPRKNQLKIIRLDQQILSSPTVTNIVNLQFGEDSINIFKRNLNRRGNKKLSHLNEQRRQSVHKDLYKTRYHELFKQSLDNVFKNTIQIGPCARTILKQNDIGDIYVQRKLINIEKLAFPLRDTKRDMTARSKYKTVANRTSRADYREELGSVMNKNNRSMAGQGDNDSREKYSGSIFDISLVTREQLRPDYKKQIATLVPLRKPVNKKDYFVFGLSDRANTSESNGDKLQIYRDLLWRINFSNGLFVCTPDQITQPYKFYVGQGNNANLIRGILRRRFWWTQASSKTQQGLNFVWTQLKINSFFPTQQSGIIPQYFVMERVQSQSARATSTSSCVNFRQSEADFSKKLFGRIDYKIWKNHCNKNEKSEKKITQSTYQKRLKMFQKKHITKIQESRLIKMHNHLQNNFYIGNKKALFYNLKRYLELKDQDPFSMLPLTFHITKGTDDPQYSRFLTYFQKFEEQKRRKKNVRNIWIVKPGQNTNRGNGISVCYGVDDIKVRLKGRERNGDGKLRTFIIQKYIENPLLYNKRKFDIRHYMLITCINGSFKGYWFEEGYVRTSSAQFNLKVSKDPLIHLTNDAIQKHTTEYGKYEKANKLSYAQLDKYLQTSFPKKADFFNKILPKMKHYGSEAVRATYWSLDNERRRHNFQLLGLDFMIDEDFHPWLIEVNTNPCLELCCPHLQRIIPSLIQNLFKICVDPLFPPPQAWPANRKVFVGDDPLSQNRFELIFDELSDGKDIQRIYRGEQRLDRKMGKIQQDDETFQNEGQVQWQKET